MICFHVITLFPSLIEQYCSVSIVSRGIEKKLLKIKTYNPRDFCADKYRKVDDTPYGGGAGMVLKPEPFFAAFESINITTAPSIIMSPQGSPYNQSLAEKFSTETDIILFCGHYEGFDERIRSLATHEISLGDYVLTGGELAALILIDSIGRLVPGVIGKSISLAQESFADGLLEFPQYTKPAVFRNMNVPKILLSGDHSKIANWRKEQSLKRTLERRPDLLEKANLSAQDLDLLKIIKKEKNAK